MQESIYNADAEQGVQIEINPGRLLVILYDGAIKYLARAKKEIASGNTATKGILLSKAHAIISEMNQALDHNTAPELCANLEQVYGYMMERINYVNSSMDAAPLDALIRQLSNLRDTWFEAVSQVLVEPAQTTA